MVATQLPNMLNLLMFSRGLGWLFRITGRAWPVQPDYFGWLNQKTHTSEKCRELSRDNKLVIPGQRVARASGDRGISIKQ